MGLTLGDGPSSTWWALEAQNGRVQALSLCGKWCLGVRLPHFCLPGVLSSVGFPRCLVSERIPSLNGPRQGRWEKPCSWPWTSILTEWGEAEPWEKGQRACQPLAGSARGAEKDGVALCGPGQPKCPRARGRLRNSRANTVHICLVLNGVFTLLELPGVVGVMLTGFGVWTPGANTTHHI